MFESFDRDGEGKLTLYDLETLVKASIPSIHTRCRQRCTTSMLGRMNVPRSSCHPQDTLRRVGFSESVAVVSEAGT